MFHYIMDILSGKRTITDYARYECARVGVAAVHVTLFFIFMYMKCTPLTIFNFFSIILYVVVFEILIRKKKYPAAFICTYLEIVLHTIFTCILLGWTFGFSLYNIGLLYISYYFAYISPSFQHKILIPTILGLANSIFTVIVRVYVYQTGPVYQYGPTYSTPISVMNYCVASVMIMLFATLHTIEIRKKEYVLQSTNQELDRLANYDPLTELRNRRSMEKELHTLLDHTNEKYCFLMGDIDDFKKFNDQYGHECGDHVLKSVSEIIRKNMGKLHIACRWGGEEFLVLLKGSEEYARTVAEKIRYEIDHMNFLFHGNILHITITLGLAPYVMNEPYERCINLADKNMYRGKQEGKNRVI